MWFVSVKFITSVGSDIFLNLDFFIWLQFSKKLTSIHITLLATLFYYPFIHRILHTSFTHYEHHIACIDINFICIKNNTIMVNIYLQVNISNTWTLPQAGFNVFYRYFRDKISWFEADAVCQFHHANLVTGKSTKQFFFSISHSIKSPNLFLHLTSRLS